MTVPTKPSLAEEVFRRLIDAHGEKAELTPTMVTEVIDLIRVSAPAREESIEPPAGRVRKVSVSMPAELIAAVQKRVGHGEFSRYVTEAVAEQHRHDLLGELLEILDDEYGPVPPEMVTEARVQWAELLR